MFVTPECELLKVRRIYKENKYVKVYQGCTFDHLETYL